MVVDEAGGLEAIHTGHAHIEQHDGELGFHQPLERLQTRVRLDEILPQVLQDGLVGQQPGGLIVHQQNVDLLVRCHTGTYLCSHMRTSDNN